MKKRGFLNIFFVALFCFFVGSFRVDAIVCEYPFSYTDEKGNVVKATIVTVEKTQSKATTSNLDVVTYIDNVKGMTKKGLDTASTFYWEPSNSDHTFVFGKNRSSRREISRKYNMASSEANDYINNVDKNRKCENIYYQTLYGDHGGATQIHVYLGYDQTSTHNQVLVSSTKMEGEGSSSDGTSDGNDELIDSDDGCAILGNEVIEFLRGVFRLIQIVGPLLAIVFGMVDFVGAVMSPEDGAMKKASKKFITRLIAAACLFLIPVILEFLLQFIEDSNGVCI